MVEAGETAPDFTLVGVQEGERERYTLSEYTASGPVLLGVYVFDFACVCSRQLRDLDWYEYRMDFTTLAISTDGPYAHERFAEEEGYSFPLLCDTDGSVLSAYDVLKSEEDGVRNVPERSLFLIDTDRTVRYKWVAENNWDLHYDSVGIESLQKAIRTVGKLPVGPGRAE